MQKIGVLGGGQLGTFLTIAAKQLGYQVTVWDPDPTAPAHAWADTAIKADFKNPTALSTFIEKSHTVTYEWENIPISLVAAIERERPVRPGSQILTLLQNRIKEKGVLHGHAFPVTPYLPILKKEALKDAVVHLGFPLILKTATAGYDGLGQWRLTTMEDAADVLEKLTPYPDGWIAEKVAPFLKELSILIARNEAGEMVTYPVTENHHAGGILRLCQVPAGISSSVSEAAASLAKKVVAALEGIGLFCIEFFLLEGEALLINEIAPRPHNSGHYTLDVCTASQFEQQLRTLCDLPFAETRLLSPAVMINILGAEILALKKPESRQKLLAIPGLKLYDYRKQEIKHRRKMGHVTLTGTDPEVLLAQAKEVQTLLAEAAGSLSLDCTA